MSFKEYLEQWLENKQTRVKRSTLNNYKRLCYIHIIPHLGHIPISNLTALDIQLLYNKLFESKKLSDENIRKIHTLIKASLTKAMKLELINKNVSMFVDSPKVHKKEIKVWDVRQIKQFLRVANGHRYYIAFLLAITTGMRRGEVLGLRWKDVNFQDGSVHITQILSNDGKELEAGAKTRSGLRAISLPNETIGALDKHQ